MLPAFLDEVSLGNLTLGGDTVDVTLRRSGTQVVVDVADRRGAIRVLTTS